MENKVWVLSLVTGIETEKTFTDLEKQRRFLIKAKKSPDMIVTGYTYDNQEEGEYLSRGL